MSDGNAHSFQPLDEPIERLTRMCDAMTTTLEEHPEYDDAVQCVIFLNDEEHGGLVINGYDDPTAAVAAVLVHIRALMQTMGSDLEVIFIPNDAGSIDTPT